MVLVGVDKVRQEELILLVRESQKTQGFKTLSFEFTQTPHSRSHSFPIFPIRSWQIINPTGIVILQPTQLNYGLICSKVSLVATRNKRFFGGCYRNSDYPTVSS